MPIALLVDDDADFRSVLGEVLEGEGYWIVEAANGREAIRVLNSLRPDVILIDLLMPVMNGWSLFAAIEDRPELRTVPVVFLSALPHMAPGGGSLILKKPLDLPALMKLLDALGPGSSPSEMRLKAAPRTAPAYRLRGGR
jgi:CheY-like chemotaxis protein